LCQDAGELYMLMELALGGELFTLLSRRAPLPDNHAKFYTAQVVSIFSYMQSLKVIYRDLKPEKYAPSLVATPNSSRHADSLARCRALLCCVRRSRL
jgi:serine/threonine protein kinase